jgi:radical SAM-linked protein
MEYGRRSKRVKTTAVMQVPNSKVRVKWGKTRAVRFLSHLDNTRVFERALRRTRIPVSYSRGYHPHQRVAFGPPLTLGYSSEAEYFDIQLEAPYNVEMFDRLNGALPDGFSILQTKALIGKGKSLSALINLACYDVVLPLDLSDAEEKRGAVFERESLVVNRKTKTDIVEVDIRPGIIDLELAASDNGTVLSMTTGMGNICFARPSEVLQFGFELTEKQVLALPIHRKNLLIQLEEKRVTPFDVI